MIAAGEPDFDRQLRIEIPLLFGTRLKQFFLQTGGETCLRDIDQQVRHFSLAGELTQQLAATLAVSAGPGWARNLEDVTLALWLEARLTKHEILELYLNSADFGGGASGIEAAAQRTFGKSARELTLAEAAVIAGFLGAPTEQTPIMSAEAARARGRLVLAKMLEAGLISAEAERRAAGESIAFATPRRGEDAIELLLGRMPSPAGAGHAAMAATAAEESTQALPSASRSTSASKSPAYPIDADVIARALAEESAAKSAATAPREPTQKPQQLLSRVPQLNPLPSPQAPPAPAGP